MRSDGAPAGTSHAVFLSYASQDAPAAQRLCDSLRAAGIEVWFDRSELRGGDVWDQQIRQQIRDCALFVPVISATTAARGEGYFRLEWSLAEQRAQRMARNRPFIVPVCIDATPEGGADVPEAFTRVQWTRLPAGQVPSQFAARLAVLLSGTGDCAAAATGQGPSPHPAAAAGTAAPPPPAVAVAASRRVALGGALLALALALVALCYWAPWRHPAGANAAAAPAGVAPSRPVPQEQSVAVLPFTDLSEKHDQEYFSDGLAEELIDTLTKIPNLRVPARTSSFSFKGKSATVGEIARALGVNHILEGSVRKAGERLRITAQLVRADNGFHLWSQTYDRDARDIFAVQDDIARAVSGELQATLMGAGAAPVPQQATSPEAYTLYLQARHLTSNDTGRDLDRAVVLYRQALDLDPGYAPAWAGLALTQGRRVSQGVATSGAVYADSIGAAQRAIALNPRLADGYLALAMPYLQYEHNWAGASEAVAQALRLDPNSARAQEAAGHLSAATGSPSEAIEHFRRAVQADPLNLLDRKYLGRALHYARHPQESAAELRRAIELDPQFPGLHYELGRALLMLGDAAGARAAFEGEPDEVSSWRTIGLPLGYHATGQAAAAQAALVTQLANSSGGEFQVAETYAFFGDATRAFEWLEKARTRRDPGVLWCRRDALLDSLSGDPRFAAYLKRLGLPPPRED